MASPLRLRHVLLAALTGLTAVVAALVPATAPASAAQPVPDQIVALGDSITRAFNACGWYVDCTSRSWSTGTSSEVNSHYLRIRAKNSTAGGYNAAKSGAKVSSLASQAEQAVFREADYVTILIGANDACTESESTMTSVAAFETRFRSGMRTLRSGLPGAAIFVASIPDIYRLWETGKDNSYARTAWDWGNICQSMLAKPRSKADADEQRRQRVRQRVIDYNAVLARVCAEDVGCKFDGNAVFNYRFTLNQISGWDYFHPNTSGQKILASVTYAAGFGW